MAGPGSSDRQNLRAADAARRQRQRDDVASSTPPTSDTLPFTLQESGGSTSAAPPPSKKRGKYRGLQVLKMTTTGVERINVKFDPNGKKPIGKNASLLTSELGLISRTNIPLEFKTWTAVKTPLRDQLMARVNEKFSTSDVDEAVFRTYCLEEIKQRYKQHRGNLSAYFKSFETTTLARQNPYGDIAPNVWNDLCTHYDSDAFKHKSLKNRENRAKLPYPHLAGTKSFVAHRADHEAEASEGGVTQRIGEIELFQLTHEKQQRGWVTPIAQQRHTQMVELRDQPQTSTETSSGITPVSEGEICSQVLGKRYMWGLGERRSGSSRDSSQQIQMLQAKVDQITTERQQERETFTKLKEDMEQRQRELDQRLKDFDEWRRQHGQGSGGSGGSGGGG